MCCARGRDTINLAARQQRHHNYGNDWCVHVCSYTPSDLRAHSCHVHTTQQHASGIKPFRIHVNMLKIIIALLQQSILNYKSIIGLDILTL